MGYLLPELSWKLDKVIHIVSQRNGTQLILWEKIYIGWRIIVHILQPGELKPRVHNCVYKRPKIKCTAEHQLINMIKENGWCTQKFLAKAEEILSNLAKRNKWEPD